MRKYVQMLVNCGRLLRASSFSILLLFFCVPAAAGAQASVASASPSNSVEREGTLEVMVEDYKDHAVTRHFLAAQGHRTELHFKGGQRKPASGTKIRVKGARRSDDSIEVAYLSSTESGSGSSGTATYTPTTFPTYGAQNTLVILVNFQDKPTEQPWTSSEVRSFMFNTISDLMVENSYQQASVTGDVYGWYTIPVSSTVCDQTAIANAAKAAASSAGANLSAYSHYVYLFPKGACQFSGASTVGGSPSQAWINGKLTVQVVGHELGHSFGLEHSIGLNCNGETLGDNCQTMEYGDTVDLMGGAPTGHFNAYQKERLGWLNSGASSPPIITVEASGTYTLDTYELAGSQAKALRVLKSHDTSTGWKTWYYVELRQAIGADGWIANSLLADPNNILNGVLIHTAPDWVRNTSMLLDLTPETQHLRDPALVAGLSYSDADAGVTITTNAVANGRATVTVTLGGGGTPPATCTRANPTLSLTGPTQAVAPGTAVSFNLTVQNNDSAGCGASSFNLSRTVPGGWSGALAANALSLSPGASSTTSLSVTSASTAADGSYAISVAASNAAAVIYTVDSAGTVLISSSATSGGRKGGKTRR